MPARDRTSVAVMVTMVAACVAHAGGVFCYFVIGCIVMSLITLAGEGHV